MRSTSDVDLSHVQSCDQIHLSFSRNLIMNGPGQYTQTQKGDCVTVHPS